MLEKFKSLSEGLKTVFIWIITPAVIIGSVLIKLYKDREDLRKELARVEAEKAIAEALAKKDIAHKEAEDAEKEYERTRDEYLSGNKSGKGD